MDLPRFRGQCFAFVAIPIRAALQRALGRLTGTAAVRTCNLVFDDYLEHCESLVAKEDLAAVTLSSYRSVLNRVWRPKIAKELFHRVRYSGLVKMADEKPPNNAAIAPKQYFGCIRRAKGKFWRTERDYFGAARLAPVGPPFGC